MDMSTEELEETFRATADAAAMHAMWNRPRLAEYLFRHAYRVAAEIGDPLLMAEASVYQAAILRRLGQYAAAYDAATRVRSAGRPDGR